MELWTVLLVLSLWDTIVSVPISGETKHEFDYKECCPCPGEEAIDQGSSPTQAVEQTPNDCPCKLQDSTADSSMITPTLQVLQPLMKALETKSEPKPILEPEVGLASSVLETLREVSDKEYEDALIRDAQRSASREPEPLQPLSQHPTHSPSEIINIIVRPEKIDDFDTYPQESRVQETRCDNLQLSGTNDFERTVSESSPKTDNNTYTNRSFLANRNLLDFNDATSNINENIMSKPLERSTLQHVDPYKTNVLPRPELIPLNSNIGELIKKHWRHNIDNVNSLWNSKIPNLTLPNILDNIKDLHHKSLSEDSLLKTLTNSNKNYGDMVLNKDKQYPTLNHLEPVSYFKHMNDLKPSANGITKPVKLKDLLKLKDVEFIQPTNINDIVNPKPLAKFSSKQESEVLKTTNFLSDNILALPNEFESNTNIDILPGASDARVSNITYPGNETIDGKDIIKTIDLRNTLTSLDGQVTNTNMDKVLVESHNIFDDSNRENQDLTDIHPSKQLSTNIINSEINIDDTSSASSETPFLFFSSTMPPNSYFETTTINNKVNNDRELNDWKTLPSVQPDAIQTREKLKKNFQESFRSNMPNNIQQVNSEIGKNNSESLQKMGTALVDRSKEIFLNDNLPDHRFFTTQKKVPDSVFDSNVNIETTLYSDSINTDNVEMNYKEKSIDLINKEMITKFQPKGSTEFDNNEDENSNNDQLKTEKVKLNTEINISKEIVTESNSESMTGKNKFPSLVRSASALAPIQADDGATDMNVEASESIVNRYPPVNLDRSKQRITILNEPNLMDDNSYRTLVAKHLQQINNLLERNNIINYNNKCPDSTGKQVPLTEPREHLLNNLDSNIDNFQNKLFKDSAGFSSNVNENIKDSLPYTERESLKSVLDRNEHNLKNKINDYFKKKELDKESFNVNSNQNVNRYKNLEVAKDKWENVRLRDTAEGPSNRFQTMAEKPFKNTKTILEKNKNFFPKSNNILRDPFSTSDSLKFLSDKFNNPDFIDTNKFHFPSNTKQLKTLKLPERKKPFLIDDFEDKAKKSFTLPNISENMRTTKKMFDEFITKPTSLKMSKPDLIRSKNLNKHEDLLNAIRNRTPNLNSARSLNNFHTDNLQNIRDKIKTFGTEAKADIADRFRDTNRPDILESIKKTFDIPHLFENDKPKLKAVNSNKYPILKKNINLKEQKSSASVIIPNQVKGSRDLFSKSKTLDDSTIMPMFSSSENLEIPRTYVDLDRYTNTDEPLTNEYRTPITSKPTIKLKDHKADLAKMYEASRKRPSWPSLLSTTGNKYADNLEDTLPFGSENLKVVHVTEKPLQENMSYKCKMVCVSDDK